MNEVSPAAEHNGRQIWSDFVSEYARACWDWVEDLKDHVYLPRAVQLIAAQRFGEHVPTDRELESFRADFLKLLRVGTLVVLVEDSNDRLSEFPGSDLTSVPAQEWRRRLSTFAFDGILMPSELESGMPDQDVALGHLHHGMDGRLFQQHQGATHGGLAVLTLQEVHRSR